MDKIQQAANILKHGGIVIFPTDTAFGIGCRMDNVEAVRRLNRLLLRPATQPLPVLINSVGMAQNYLQPLPDKIRKLMQKFWPGGLTIVYYCKTALVPAEIRGERETLGVRLPDHDVVLELIEKIEGPLVGTSANFHGQETPYNFIELDKRLIQEVDAVVQGKCKIKQASTVVDCTVKPWKILRQGAVVVELARQ